MTQSMKSSRACHLLVQLVLLSAFVFPVAVSTSRCSNPSPAPKEVPEGNDALELLRSFQITGYFSGGDGLFAPDDDNSSYIPRSFALSPYKVARTTDPAYLEVAATLALSGSPSDHGGRGARRQRRRHRYVGSQTASFHLHGYYNTTSGELCVLSGSGSYSVHGGFVEHVQDVNLRLRVPSTPSLADPFVTGLLHAADFETISLVAYVESDRYAYSEKKPSCPPPPTPAHAVRSAFLALVANFSCSRLRPRSGRGGGVVIGMGSWRFGLRELLVSTYRLENTSRDASSPASSPFALSRGGLRMHVNQLHCTANGSVRAYVVFSNGTDAAEPWQWRNMVHDRFLVKEEALVADGYWDATSSRICLRACRVAVHSSAPKPSMPSTDLKVGEQCGIGMSFWFPAVWTIRERSVVSGLLWNASHDEGGDKHAGAAPSGAISASSIDGDRRSNLTDVKYNYTVVEKAKTQYIQSVLSKSKKGGSRATAARADRRVDLEDGPGDHHGGGLRDAVVHLRRPADPPRQGNPASAPATSIAMLAMLALVHVTHLALNVDALFVGRRTHYVPFSTTGGWLELNEVVLRVPTLVAFALQLCLLQLVRSSRRSADRAIAKKWSLTEGRSLRIYQPLYLFGGLVAGAVHVINNGRAATGENPLIVSVAAAGSTTLWGALASYAGLVLDGFLLPQVILNVFSRSRARAISPWFYVGVTVLRATPHAYDALRARGCVPSARPSSYMYARPRDDLFGVAWDVAVSLGAASLALLLFLQQRLGGAFFVRGKRFDEYEMVSTTVGSPQEVDTAMD
uniref:RING-type E3 ubiquitin transferase n=1 Tax=Oryza brachyantha TaxID=4533 RepID=J3L2V2_ORYBR